MDIGVRNAKPAGHPEQSMGQRLFRYVGNVSVTFTALFVFTLVSSEQAIGGEDAAALRRWAVVASPEIRQLNLKHVQESRHVTVVGV